MSVATIEFCRGFDESAGFCGRVHGFAWSARRAFRSWCDWHSEKARISAAQASLEFLLRSPKLPRARPAGPFQADEQ